MRILTLVPGRDALPDTLSLWREIREFNGGIDFRLRFLHIDIEDTFVTSPEIATELDQSEGLKVHSLETNDALQAAASLALLLDRTKPALFVIAGAGPYGDAGVAAAAAARVKLAFFGAQRGCVDGSLDLGADARQAVERITGVAREIE